MVSIRKMRPCVDELSSTHAGDVGAGATVETLPATSLPATDRALDREIDAFERGDNCSSLAATAVTRIPCGSRLAPTSCPPSESCSEKRGGIWRECSSSAGGWHSPHRQAHLRQKSLPPRCADSRNQSTVARSKPEIRQQRRRHRPVSKMTETSLAIAD